VYSEQVIPREGYKTWTLFLVCDPAWLQNSANSNANLKLLHDQFIGLGNALGARNATIWFFRRSSTDPSDYDGERASDYCATYRLTAEANPVVVVTTKYPVPFGGYALLEATGNCVHVSLHGLNSADADTLLGLLSDQIRLGKLDQQQIDSKEYWLSWESLLKNTLTKAGKLGHGVTIEIDTRVLKVHFSGKDIASDAVARVIAQGL
jgi:hypothetical protein